MPFKVPTTLPGLKTVMKLLFVSMVSTLMQFGRNYLDGIRSLFLQIYIHPGEEEEVRGLNEMSRGTHHVFESQKLLHSQSCEHGHVVMMEHSVCCAPFCLSTSVLHLPKLSMDITIKCCIEDLARCDEFPCC